MRVEVLKSYRVRPEKDQSTRKSAILPAIDSWYAQWRTLVPIYLFNGYNGEDMHSQLLESFSKTINIFPQLEGTLEPCIVDGAVDGDGQPLRRIRLVWADNNGPGAEFIAAKTKARVHSLVQPYTDNVSGFLWDRSEASSLRPLFPQATPKTSGLRVQVTSFRCGGFSLAVDCDHGLADAYTVALFMQYWGAIHTQMFTPEINLSTPTTALPRIIFDPEYVHEKLSKIDDKEDGQFSRALLQKARQLPTRRPDLRKLSSKLEQGTTTTPPEPKMVLPRNGQPSMPPTPSVSVPYMLHFSASEYERITRQIQNDASIQVTDQVAIVAFLWAALNRARSCVSAGPPLELHLPTSFRWKLDLPHGLLGSPLVAIMMDGSGGSYTDAVALAIEITRTLDRYDEEALLAVVYDASLRSSPGVSANLGERRERMEFTSGVASGAGMISFGGKEPAFFGPMFLPVDELFIMSEGMPGAPIPPGLSSKWYRYGANIFFSTSRDVVHALAADPALTGLEFLSDD